MANERVTEELVRQRFRTLGYYADEDCWIDEQRPRSIAISDLLRTAGKRGRGGSGNPEFIVTTPTMPDLVILVECKADVSRHQSPTLDRPADYAVDGVLHYARYVSREFTVIAIAVSGDSTSSQTSCYLWSKSAPAPGPLLSPQGREITSILPLSDFSLAASFDPNVKAKREHDLLAFSVVMHEFMRDEAELEEKEKPLAVAGSLIALHQRAFALSYENYPARELQ